MSMLELPNTDTVRLAAIDENILLPERGDNGEIKTDHKGRAIVAREFLSSQLIDFDRQLSDEYYLRSLGRSAVQPGAEIISQ